MNDDSINRIGHLLIAILSKIKEVLLPNEIKMWKTLTLDFQKNLLILQLELLLKRRRWKLSIKKEMQLLIWDMGNCINIFVEVHFL